MKKTFIYAIIPTIVSLSSCADLSLEPNFLTGSNFPKTDADAIVATNAIYVPESKISATITYFVDAASDATISGEAVLGDGGATLSNLTYGTSNTNVDYIWKQLYIGISNANALIEALGDASSVNPTLAERLTNEARFLRAHYYFYLVQLFGDVPLVLSTGGGIGVPRDDVHQVYSQIVADLQAATALPLDADYPAADKGRASKGAAYALLAKVHLTWATTPGVDNPDAHYTAAVTAASQVTGYSLTDNFLDNWNKNNRYPTEHIFSASHIVGQEAAGDGGNHQAHCAFATTFDDETPHLVVSDSSFFTRFEPDDQRYEGSYLFEATNPDNGKTTRYTLPRYRKYIDVDNIATSAFTRDHNRTILRYADVLLIHAEALNELGHTTDALPLLNQVRHRAFHNVTPPLYPENFYIHATSQEEVRDAIRRERFFEFVYEQSRWFDLVRWKVLVKTIRKVEAQEKNNHVSLKHYRFPIPQSERNLNPNLTQNPGYDDNNLSPYLAPDYEVGTDGF
ncbi:MAG: RagB/SusD family nutrient uptake outer membrane protein [Tannerellaceae bacterium]|jgi:hypothetical protein|nr:RagB/SusD family nutrient uptake outer membrane protein [Tannerellaceae bacterium]